ncbi:MAG: hypothetical protein ABNO82_00450 [Candidatus Shikimatogenerans sp. Tder]|uniref:DNA-directed RNA polymerase RpoA/D/Rpb3-type domain-containing protein n=1 Tax=Candidatus Shikimatogenerans sp. Tder TaxID=3158566 RepID=A0AAU7QUH7_9FLAO
MKNKIIKNKIIIKNLNKNHGITIGNSLRRILITSIKGFAISAIKINNIKHEYESIEGIYEDINNIILNIKQIILKIYNIKNINKKKIYIIKVKLKNKKQFLAGHIEKFTKIFKIINKDFVILNFSKNIKIDIKFFITYNKGYIPSNENILINKYEYKKKIKNLIKIDSIYTPIKNVNYYIKKNNNKENLFINIITNNTLSPLKALYKSTCILLYYYNNIINTYKKKKDIKILKIDFKYFKYLKYFNNEKLLIFLKKNNINNIKEFKKKYKILFKNTKNKFLLKLIKKIYLKYKK